MLAFLNVIENEVIRSYLEELYLLYSKDLVIIVRRLSINQYHKRIRRATTNIDDLADVISDDSIMMPEINILRLDQSQEVARLLDNINEGSVRTKLTRARQACKDVLGGERYEYA